MDVSVGTAYEADLETTRSLLEEVAGAVDGGKSDLAPQVYLTELGGPSINWSVWGGRRPATTGPSASG